MQTLKLIQKEDEHDKKLKFLLEFIHKITLAINPPHSAIKAVQNELKTMQCMKELGYYTEGLKNQKCCIDRFATIKTEKTDPIERLYIISPHFSLLNRAIALLYEDSEKRLGEENSIKLFKGIYLNLKRQYSEPDLEGYIPNEVTGKAAAAAAAAAAFGTRLVDNMIDYLVEEIIEKGVKPEVRIIKPERNIPEEVKNVYIEMLGPLGSKQFEKIEEGLNINNIAGQIEGLAQKGILSGKEAESFKSRIFQILGEKKLPTKEEAKAVYAQMLGPLAMKAFKEVEQDLNKERIIEQIRVMEEQGIIMNVQAKEFKEKIERLFG